MPMTMSMIYLHSLATESQVAEQGHVETVQS